MNPGILYECILIRNENNLEISQSQSSCDFSFFLC